jgi:hypothetical protein
MNIPELLFREMQLEKLALYSNSVLTMVLNIYY